MGQIFLTKMFLTLGYCYGIANDLSAMRNCDKKTIVSSLKKYSKDISPNLFVLIKLAATLLVHFMQIQKTFFLFYNAFKPS